MQEQYERINLIITEFDIEDIITTSGEDNIHSGDTQQIDIP